MYHKKVPGSHCNLRFQKTITRWDEAIPLGNGLCGALIWGPSNGLRFSLDRGDIWDNTPYEGVESKEFTYENMVKLAREGNIEKIRSIFDGPYNHLLPTKLPAGKIIFDIAENENVISELNLANAEARINIQDTELKGFLHAENKVGFIHVNKPLGAFSFRIERPQYSVRNGEGQKETVIDSVQTASLSLLSYNAAKIIDEEYLRGFEQEITEEFSYGVFAKYKQTQSGTEIAYYVGTSNDGAQWQQKTIQLLSQALEKGYAQSLQEHCAWWEGYWAKSSVALPDLLMEKNWYLTQYFLGACSRKGCFPMPLQGLWTADDGSLPPWKGDYHHDLNTQMSYCSYFKANHMEEGECFLDFLWDLVACAREFAKSFYNSKGLCLPSTMTISGAPLGGWGMYSLSPTNQLWLCQLFERHYRFSGDKAFLENRVYPYLSETAAFILGLLEERDGAYYLPISSSPEIHDDRLESFVTPNSNYDLSLMRYLFTALIGLSRELENGDEEKWKEILEKLPALAVNEDHVLMLSPDESLMESHRHFSHAMAIYPLRLLPYENKENCRIIDATISNLEALGTGYWVGFTFAWMAELYAIQGNGNGAAYQLQTFWNNYCSPNGFHLNGDYKNRGTSCLHYRPFTLEANFCAADALQEMLLQSENGVLNLFPAIPEEWLEDTVSFDSFRAEKGLLVSAKLEKGQLVSLSLFPQYCQRVILRKIGGLCELLSKGDIEVVEAKEGIALNLCAGREYHFGF